MKPGSWPSPISASLLAVAGNRNKDVQVVGDDLWWDEMRPSESGRTLVVSQKHGDLIAAPWNASSGVHEYGGISWHGFIKNGSAHLAFANKADQRIYVAAIGGEPVAFSPEPPAGEDHRYIELNYVNGEIWCIREKHAAGKITRAIVALSEKGVRVLDSASQFYAHPRISRDGTLLAWVCWEHPQMPWDGTEIKVAKIVDGELQSAKVLAGNLEESCLNPEWGLNNDLFYISDKSGWWNLWSVTQDGTTRQVIDDKSEWGIPLWQLGMKTMVALDDGRILATHGPVDNQKLIVVDTATSKGIDIDCEFKDFVPSISQGNGKAYAFASSSTLMDTLIEIDLKSFQVKQIFSKPLPVDAGYFSKPYQIEAKRADGRSVFGIFYPAKNPQCEASEKPPLLVMVHGGPTAHATASISLEHGYFTSRGIAVVEVNYGGSTGYGREYRNLLRQAWGIVDREDVIEIVDHLIKAGEVDGEKILIRGGSAGGFTVLNVLVNSDRFAAGASYYGVADCTALALETHDFESRYLDSMIGAYPAEADLYIERSPLTYSKNLTSPLIIFQGLDDKVVLPAQSEAFRDVCVEKGIKHEYHPFEGEGHGFRKASSIITAHESELKFFGEVLGFTPLL
jgi:dipeptidyl aminopeptidase/acylaminoacyl peptidase